MPWNYFTCKGGEILAHIKSKSDVITSETYISVRIISTLITRIVNINGDGLLIATFNKEVRFERGWDNNKSNQKRLNVFNYN
jgi:hypothetical protein